MTRDLDLTLFGATGFVGRLVARQLLRTAPPGLAVALAGRSPQRLARLRAELGPRAAGWPLLTVDARDAAAVAAMADRSRVVVSTVGPYQRHGLPALLACARSGADYADLTGEVLFVREAVEHAHGPARRTGARVVVSCGYDSLPSDLAVHLLHRAARADGAGGLTDTTTLARGRGRVGGGTLATLRTQLERLREEPALRAVVRDPEALSGGHPGRSGQEDPRRPFVEQGSRQWVAPFVMGPYNTRVVRRSHALTGAGYGPRFRYRELVPCGTGPGGATTATALTAGTAALAWALGRRGVVGRVTERLLPNPGTGPTEREPARGWFRMSTVTAAEDGTRYGAVVAADQDPGYVATAVMLAESALALLRTREDGPQAGGGVLTPAVALGDQLPVALRGQGMTVSVRRLGR